MGNSSQAVVLPGQVQAVKEGTGIDIAADGTISVDEGDLTTFVRLNNGAAYNSYVWPGTTGAGSTFLMTTGAGALEWQRVRIPVNTAAPTTPAIGEMWFDCSTGQFKVWESCTTGTAQWQSVSQPGLPVLPANTSAAPGFTGGSGTSGAPYACTVATVAAGNNIFIVNTVTITGLAPNQYVPIVDLNAVTNGGRFSFSNNYADSSGNLVFQTIFKDQPASPAGTVYNAAIKVGYASVYISAQVSVVSVISISDPGTIAGTPEVGQTLTYTTGTATGGTGVYGYTWQWVRDSDNGVLQTGGATYVIPASLEGDKVFVRLTATDTVPQSATANTDLFPASGVITKGPFPNPTPPSFPGEIGVDSCFTWDGPGTTLTSSGCVEFNVNGGAFSQAAKAVATGDTVCSRWVDVPTSGLCGDAVNGTTINGCIYDTNHEACGSLTIDRVPSTFPPFATITDHVASTVATSNGSTPFGYNATSFVTGSLSAGASTLQGSVDGGATWAAIPTGGETFGINPGETLQVRYTTGGASNTTYVATINLGQGGNVTTQTFTVVNDAVPFPSTSINFPTYIPDVTTTTWNEAGTTAITSTGCIEISTDGVTWGTSLSISFGNTLYTRWASTAACGDKASGPITGCVKSAANEECSTLNINRVPTTFPSIPSVAGTLPGNYATSAPVTPSGFNAPSYLTAPATPAGVSNVEASVDGGTTWTAVPASGTTFEVPVNASVEFRFQGAAAATTYSVPFALGNGVSSVTQNFSVTTGKPDFPGVDISFPTYIPQVTQTTWAGGGKTLTASGCLQISLDNATWTNASETIANGQTLYTRWNPSAACSGAAEGTTIAGCISDANYEECSSLTIDRVPSNFPPITAVTGITPGAYGTSDAVSPGGFNAPTYVTVTSVPTDVTNIEASTDGGATWFGVGTATSSSAVVDPDQSIKFRFKGANPLTSYSVQFRLGDGVSYTAQSFTVTNSTASFPSTTFSPAGGPNAAPASVNVGSLKGTATGTWADGSVPVTVTGDIQLIINGGAPVSAGDPAVTINNSDTVDIIWDLAAINAAADGATVTGSFAGGTYQNDYSIVVNRQPAAYDFADLSNQALSSAISSASVTPSGFNVPVSLSATGAPAPGLTTIKANVGGGGFAALPQTVNPGQAIIMQGVTGGTVSTGYSLTTTLGTGANATDVWTVTTSAATPTIATPSIVTPSDGTGNLNPALNTPAGITLIGDDYTPSNGASTTQTSSTWEVYKAIAAQPRTSAITVVTPGDIISASTITGTPRFPSSTWEVTFDPNWATRSTFTGACGTPSGGPPLTITFGTPYTVNSSFYFVLGDFAPWDAASYNSGLLINNLNMSNFTTTATTIVVEGQSCFAAQVNLPAGYTINSLGSKWDYCVWAIVIDGERVVSPYVDLTFGDTTGFSDMAAGNSVVEIGGGGDAGGEIEIIDTPNKKIRIFPTTGTWTTGAFLEDTSATPVVPPAPTTNPPDANYTATTGSPYTGTNQAGAVPPEVLVPQADLAVSSTYYARVQYATTNASAATSNFSAWSSFGTASSFLPTPGGAYGGGYFAGQILDGTTVYNLVVAPIEGDNSGPAAGGALKGQYGGTTPQPLVWKTSVTADAPAATAENEVYGKPATDAFSDPNHPVFEWCKNGPNGPNNGGGIGGFTDWYIPAKYELEVLYYFLKPTTTTNNTPGFGANPYAVSPEPVNTTYSGSSPGQTTAALFKQGQAQAFSGNYYWTATQSTTTPTSAWNQMFGNGTLIIRGKNGSELARAIRRVAA